jgi:hypothetical protein
MRARASVEALGLAIWLVVGATAPAAQAATHWYTWYTSPGQGVSYGVWKSVTTGAQYNGASVETLNDDGA